MSTALKCPNPSCPYLFDPTTVPPGVVLACPRCAMRFTLGPPAPPPSPADMGGTATFSGPPPGFPTAPPGHAPAARGAAPPPPTDVAFGTMTPETAKPDGQEGPRLPVRQSRFQTAVLAGVGIVALCAAGIAVWWKVTHPNGTPSPVDTATNFRELNLSFDPPTEPWSRDDKTAVELGSPYFAAYTRDNPSAHVAFGALDFDTREPRPSELRDRLNRALEKLLEPDTRREYADEAEKTWMGVPVQYGFKFTGGLRTGGKVEGDALTVSHKGVGYWFLSWTGEGLYEEQRAAFADARKRCKILDHRTQWKEKQSSVVPFKNNVLGYTLLDAEGIWAEVSDPERVKAEDPKADKYLTAKLRQKGRDFGEEAELVVYVLPAGGDPLADARAYVEAQANENTELRGKNTFTTDVGQAEGDPTPNTVQGTAPHVMLRSRNDRDPTYSWLYAVSAIKVGDKTVAACAKCRWSSRAAFDTKFEQVVKSLRPE